MLGLNHRGQQQADTAISCSVLAAAAIVIRIFCKIRHKQGFKADDCWILIALAFFWAADAVAIWGRVTGGGGLEMKELVVAIMKKPQRKHEAVNFLESTFIGVTLAFMVLYAVKMSVLIFYRRIFLVMKSYRQASLALMIISTVWIIAIQIGNLLICRPINVFWYRDRPGSCANFNVFFLWAGITDTLIDVAILVLPIRMAFKLQVPMRTKVAIAGIFSLGGLVVITSIIRLQYSYQPKEKYVNLFYTDRWLNIHILIAIICACLPIYKPLWTSLSSTAIALLSRYATSLATLLRSGQQSQKSTDYVRMGDVRQPKSSTTSKEEILKDDMTRLNYTGTGQTSATISGGRTDGMDYVEIPVGTIAYSRKIDVV